MTRFLGREPLLPVQANVRGRGVATGQPGTGTRAMDKADARGNPCHVSSRSKASKAPRSATCPSEYIEITFGDYEDRRDTATPARALTSHGLTLGSADVGDGPIVVPDVPTCIPSFGRARGTPSRRQHNKVAAKSWLEGPGVYDQTRPWQAAATSAPSVQKPSAELERESSFLAGEPDPQAPNAGTAVEQAPLHGLPGGSGEELAMQMRINKALTSAAKTRKVDCISKVLRVAATNLHLMNGVNLATAVHRLARTCQGAPGSIDSVTQDPVFHLMLERIESKGQKEIELQDSSMPANCCTIITWSCAVLRIFVPNLLVVLARVAARSLVECQTFEITNMLWGCAELCKREPQTAAGMEGNIQELVDATARVMMVRDPGSWKVQVLISALVSITAFPFAGELTTRLLLLSIVEELTERNVELETANSQPVATACHVLRLNHPQVFDEIMNILSTKRTSLLSRVVRDGSALMERWHAWRTIAV
ncbi:unnamed protein product [Symbiodinium natans]|uniref:Uncharacterized protein n=1 Tax=Symbiodinium natans TaxID=878477 RepID=A0A812UNT3_9DINO|nr:unnamed protein product [Symbiodinium natans]